MFYEYSMTLRELLLSVDAEAYTSVPLFDELLKTKPEYGSDNRIKVKVLNGEIAVSNVHGARWFLELLCPEKHRGGASRQGARSPRKRLPTQYLIPLATANIVTATTILWIYLFRMMSKSMTTSAIFTLLSLFMSPEGEVWPLPKTISRVATSESS